MREVAMKESVTRVLQAAGIAAGELRIEPCGAGGNNRVFRVAGPPVVLAAKQYFRDERDPRDRLGAEFGFIRYARAAGIECVPAAVACDAAAGLALYEFIDGKRLEPAQILSGHVEQARDFFLRLNAPAARAHAAGLPDASEARFSIAGQLELLEQRIARLEQIPPNSESGRATAPFVAALRGAWQRVREGVLDRCRGMALDPAQALAPEDRCVSPSDFGFHNALAKPDGQLVFIDFEYAGWDDPAKAMNDFFCQPAVPVPASLREEFIRHALGFSARAQALMDRASLLMPVFQLKWCCIIMNDFLPGFGARRALAHPGLTEAERMQTQLDKARRVLAQIDA